MGAKETTRPPIILVRHAQPEQLPPERDFHWTDTKLTPFGRQQAAAVARRLGREIGDRPCRIVSSDLQRAAQTARAIARRLGRRVKVETTGELREFNGGVGEFDPKDRIAAQAGKGENWRQFYGRVSGCMDRLFAEQDRLLIVVSHYGTGMNIVHWWLGLKLQRGDIGVSFGSMLTAISVLKVSRNGKHTLERLNDTTHLHVAGLKVPPML